LLDPVARMPVTMPGTLVTGWPFWGEIQLAPWMSWMRSGPGSVPPPPPPPEPTFGAPGVGASTVKSTPLLSLSAALVRWADVVLLGAGASAAPSWTTAVP
jgi:hypothetical protein